VNVTPTVQVAFATKVAPAQLPEAKAKSIALAPAKVTVVMFSVALPLFLTVMVMGALAVPCAAAGNVTVADGVIVTAGAAGAVPVPLSAALCGLPEALSPICSVA
jgi:hypothetical protein